MPKNAVIDEHAGELVTVTMTEPQYHRDYGRLEPGDEVDLDYKDALRWANLGIAESDEIDVDAKDHKVPGRVRKLNQPEAPEGTGTLFGMDNAARDAQMADLQRQISELTRLVSQAVGRPVSTAQPDEAPAATRRGRRSTASAEPPPSTGNFTDRVSAGPGSPGTNQVPQPEPVASPSASDEDKDKKS